jgi:hypothetical protein
MTPISTSTSLSIHQTIQSVWADAGYAKPTGGIVPLYELVASYPIWVAEVENLSIEQAANFLAERTGQMPELGLDSRGPLSGFFYAYQYRGSFVGCVLVEKRDPIVRRRFSVAHELGHYRLHFEPWLAQFSADQLDEGILITDALIYPDQKKDGAGLTTGDGNAKPVRLGEVILQPAIILSDEKEAEANQFAASLLMPENILRERIAAFRLPVGQPRGYLASRLASEFLVSKEAMIYRLAALQI